MFARPDETPRANSLPGLEGYSCIACGLPKEKAIGPDLPGHITTSPCECGEIGAVRTRDAYQHFDVKKPNREPYHMSRYRGGHLV